MARKIVDKGKMTARPRMAVKKARELTWRKSVLFLNLSEGAE
ncbi:hypothetical protein N0U24_11740 [Peribacillus frigoritolerans]|nr:hypothetical protein [Peribacillus frigoritolerans]MCT4477820.1 hypothetical protein [Peribacillus frigoritolerans]